ncbi:MAG TPA: S8 family serine peptidase [Rhodanobacteraceae bacterium]|nr:S8 family serine peptidase [Rhodanobacteraceae bacterium]
MKSFLFLLAMLAPVASLPARSQPSFNAETGGSQTVSPANVAAMDSERDIVLAVANPINPPATHAGSSLIGYAPTGAYGAGQRAVSTLADLQRRYGWRELTGWPIKPLDLYCIVLEPAAGTSRDALLKALANDDRVQLAEPLHDYSVYSDRTSSPRRYNDPYVGLQRGFAETDAALAQTLSMGKGVDVAVIDTGVDTNHPDLQGRIGEVRNFVDGSTAVFDRDHHGTEVAGIIAAVGDNHRGIVGMAPSATLDIYKACWYPPQSRSGARCNSLTLAKALAAVLDTRARIVNLSLGGPADPLLSRLLQRVLDDGRIVIAAMPPDTNLDGFPDGVSGVIVVRSAGAGAAPHGVLSAPGVDILTTQPDGGYDFSSGSSMAAAHVSGIAALLLSVAPKLDARGLHDLLVHSSRVSDGALQVNAAAAVEAAGGMAQLSR